ncbi:PhoU family transcriptional regulator [Candidatus Bathyarchaeota archaeon]|nr:PhoU family transcriptional regulator [Candidatus Bathyarchaeota archaeon]
MSEEALILTRKAQDLLCSILDESELLIDLAYSALIFNSKDLAEDVVEMYRNVDGMRVKFDETVLKLAKLVESPEKLWVLLRMSYSAAEIAEASLMVADVILRGLPVHDVLQPIFQLSEETFVKVTVNKGANLDGRTLGEVRLQDNTGMRIVCIKRGENWIYGPNRDTKIMAGDVLFAKGPIEGESSLKSFAELKKS